MAKPVERRVREEDVLECYLFPKFCYNSNFSDSVTEDLLLQEIVKYNKEIQAYTKDYIWHRDFLAFRPKTKQAILLEQFHDRVITPEDTTNSHVVPHIHVTLRFDEDIGDEWLTVYLMFQLTKTFDGLIARILDADGEFLLIEAGDVLPAWASPEQCQDRVFVLGGLVHVIQDKRKKRLQDMLSSVCDNSYYYRMSEKVQAALKRRISVYPEEIQKRKHKTRAYLPEKAAAILRQEPSLVAAAIRTICHSDPLERKVCRAMRYFPPEQRVMVNVSMTKCLYAMGTHCRYTGDPRTGWNLPPLNSSKYNAHLLGVKIACGLEMLVARANDERRKKKNKVSDDDEASSGAKERNFEAYISHLERTGYFKDLVEGSKEREKLVEIAKSYFIEHSNEEEDDLVELSDAERVLQAWQNIQTNDIELQVQDENALSPADSDSWLNVDPAQLDQLLHQQWGASSKKNEQEPMTVRDKVQGFLNQTSSIEGVQFYGEQSADEMKQDTEDCNRIDFDTDVFDSTLRDILDLVVPGEDDEFEGSSEGSLGGDNEDRGGEMDKYMKLLDSQLQSDLVSSSSCTDTTNVDVIERNFMESLEEEAGGSGPTGNIIGGPMRKLMHLQLQSPTNVPPDLQS